MNDKTQLIITGATGIALGVAVEVAAKIIVKKKPELKPKVETALVFTSGLLIGGGAGLLLAPQFVTKSVAASILASD